jgi:prepilin-type N-terminal cleavage/methylation domain-containing protein
MSKGMTLIELIVSIAVLAIVSAIFVSSYTNVMENQRRQSDITRLNSIDIAFEQVLLYNDAFDEVRPCVYDNNKLQVNFQLVSNANGESYVDLSKATLNNSTLLLKDKCPTLYGYLTEQIDEIINLDSASYKIGHYRVYITFNGTQVSDIRDYTITNDSIIVTNSGDSELRQHD